MVLSLATCHSESPPLTLSSPGSNLSAHFALMLPQAVLTAAGGKPSWVLRGFIPTDPSPRFSWALSPPISAAPCAAGHNRTLEVPPAGKRFCLTMVPWLTGAACSKECALNQMLPQRCQQSALGILLCIFSSQALLECNFIHFLKQVLIWGFQWSLDRLPGICETLKLYGKCPMYSFLGKGTKKEACDRPPQK